MILEFHNRDIQSGRKLGAALTLILFLLLGHGETAAFEFDDVMDGGSRREPS